MSSLRGARVALLEARMSSELAKLVRRCGGDPVCAPAVQEEALDCGEQVAALIDRLTQEAIQVVVFLSGVSVKTLFKEAERLGHLAELLAGLRKVTVVARGPKPTAVLKQNQVP